ncbi:MAG: dihydrodipicolinate synthase family protein [Anaerolineales bacterium]|jgi:4-hydroxy-tetrahydrodipicolinate synthase
MPISSSRLRGIVPAVVTPLNAFDQPDLESLQRHICVLAQEGCDGILLLGTTGEGPSMGLSEREAILDAGLEAAEDLFVMVGTGLPSLSDSLYLTRRAYQLGADVAVVLPPYYYKRVTDQGLLDFYRRLFDQAVPEAGMLMLYHIPQVTQVPLSFGLIEELVNISDGHLVGIKDSSGDLAHAKELCECFPQIRIFVGTDKLLLAGLRSGAAGCITAGANILAPLDVAVYRAFLSNQDAEPLQSQLTAAREILERYQPFPAGIKSLLALRYGNQSWNVRPPLVPLSKKDHIDLLSALRNLNLDNHLPWLSP